MVELLTIPGIILILGAFILPLIPKKVRPGTFLIFPLVALGAIWTFPEGNLIHTSFASYELHLLNVDSLSRIFGTIFALITVIGGVYAFHMKELGQQTSSLAYAGGALGVTFAGDFLTLLIFWEIMAVASSYLIWARGTFSSDKAGMRYLIVHSLGGGLLLAGILMYVYAEGSLLITSLAESYTLANVFILVGVCINAAVPPLHAWLADAYPKATITGAVFMCALTTKSAVYVLIRVFPGWEILIWAGLVMAIYGTIYALLANDIREILAYSIISQIGYMTTAIGIGSDLALNAATAHAFNHILYKGLLFMAAGAVIYATGKSKLSELGGFAKKMPAVVGLYLIGGLAISGAPFFNGFISKTMITESLDEAHLTAGILILLLATIGTFLHTGLKLPYFTWFDKAKSEFTVRQIPVNMKIAMGFAALFCVGLGLFPSLLYNYLPYDIEFQPYGAYTLVEMTQILILAFAGFWLLRNHLNIAPTISIDTDWFYRRPARIALILFVRLPNRFFGFSERLVLGITQKLTDFSKNPLQHLNPNSSAGSSVKTDGFTAAIHTAMAFILFSFVVISLFILL